MGFHGLGQFVQRGFNHLPVVSATFDAKAAEQMPAIGIGGEQAMQIAPHNPAIGRNRTIRPVNGLDHRPQAIGAIGAALTLGLRSGGVLLALLVLPLYIPVLIFGAGAVEATVSGLGGQSHLSLLGAILVASLVLAPLATAAALRVAED